MSLVVSIINYKTADLTISAASSVIEVLGSRDARVIIIDNGSGDESVELIEEWIRILGDERLLLLRSKENLGFSGGHNRVIAHVGSVDFLLLLNSDAILKPGFFDAIFLAVTSHPTVGVVAPRLEWEDGIPQESCFRLAGPASEFIRGAETGAFTRIFSKYRVALGTQPVRSEVEWVSFACVLLRGEMISRYGVMDEGYILYFEDCEYCFRARRAGWDILFEPGAKAIHIRGGSGPVKSRSAARERLPEYYWRSRTRFFRQVHGPSGPLRANLAWILGRSISNCRRALGLSWASSWRREWFDIWKGFLNPLQRRP